MSLSLIETEYLGGPQVFPTNFALGVLETEHLSVQSMTKVDGLGGPLVYGFTYDAGTGDVTVVDTLDLNEQILIKRTVPKEALYVEFISSDITPRNIDNTVKQALMAVHEIVDEQASNEQRDASLDNRTTEIETTLQTFQSDLVAAETAAAAAATSADEAEGFAAQAGRPFETRAAFLAANVPTVVTRSSFFVNGNTYAVVRDPAGPIVQDNGQTWRDDDRGRQYATRAEAVADIVAGYAPTDGTVITAGGYYYIRDAAATAIPDLPGWLPSGETYGEHFGMLSSATSAVNAAALNAAILYASTSALTFPHPASSYVNIGPGIFKCDAIIMRTRVIIRGSGFTTTEIGPPSGHNADWLKSLDWDTITGTDKNTEAEGVLLQCGFADIRINGDKANQTAGDLVKLYCKGFRIEGRVVIFNGFATNLVTEAGLGAGVSQWPTDPEGDVGTLYVRQAGSVGWLNRGPNDMSISAVHSLLNGADGIIFETDDVAPGHRATADIRHIHSYANGGRGVVFNGVNRMRIGLMRAENNDGVGLELINSDMNMISALSALDNCKVAGSYQVDINGNCDGNTMTNVHVSRVGRAAAGGVRDLGVRNRIEGIIQGDVNGGGFSTGIGLVSGGDYSTHKFTISDHSGTGGIGWQKTADAAHGRYDITLRDCETLWDNVASAAGNRVSVNGVCQSTQTRFIGVGPSADNQKEIWDVTLVKVGSGHVSSRSKRSGTFDRTLTTQQDVVINHGLLVQPDAEDIIVRVDAGVDDVVWEDLPRIANITATQVQVRFKFSSGSASAGNGTVYVTCDLT